MSLKDRILNECITSVEQLAPHERELVQADPGLTVMIEENAALLDIREGFPPPPPWENLRADVINDSIQPKEKTMTALSRIFYGKRWYVQAALAVLIITGLLAVSLLLPRSGSFSPLTPAWAASDGYMMTYVLPAPGGPGSEVALLDDIEQVVKNWVDSRKASVPADGEAYADQTKIMFKGLFQDDGMHLTIMAVNVSFSDMESLRSELGTVTGIPEPTIEEATWFHLQELEAAMEELSSTDSISVNLHDRVFNFPPDATEDEIRALLNDWIDTEYPDADMNVDVEVVDEDGQKRIRILLRDNNSEAGTKDEFIRK